MIHFPIFILMLKQKINDRNDQGINTFLISRPRTSKMIDSCLSCNDGVWGVRLIEWSSQEENKNQNRTIVKILILNFNFNVATIKVFSDIHIYHVNERLLSMKPIKCCKTYWFSSDKSTLNLWNLIAYRASCLNWLLLAGCEAAINRKSTRNTENFWKRAYQTFSIKACTKIGNWQYLTREMKTGTAGKLIKHSMKSSALKTMKVW